MSDDQMQLEEVQPESTAEETSQAPDEWSSLDGKSQERFQALANMKKQAEKEARENAMEKARLEAELKTLRETQRVPMPSVSQSKMTPEEEIAYKRMTEIGVANQEYVDRKVEEKVKAIEDRLYFDNLHSKLEREINSKKGYPAYDRAEVEAHMKEKQIYDPRASYRDLYYDEIVAVEATKNNKSKTVKTEGTASRIGASSPWTRESLQARLRQPDGLEFFRKNKEKILKMQSQLS